MNLIERMHDASSDKAAVERIEKLLTDDPSLVEKPCGSSRVWQGKIFGVDQIEAELPDGTHASREVMHHRGGCCVVVVRNEKICLVRQWRVAVGRMTLELPAGKLDPDEDPVLCAQRELRAETGLIARRIEPVILSRGVIGCSDELTRIFRAYDVVEGEAHLDDEEFVDVVWVSIADALAAIHAGVIQDSKTILGILSAALEAERSK